MVTKCTTIIDMYFLEKQQSYDLARSLHTLRKWVKELHEMHEECGTPICYLACLHLYLTLCPLRSVIPDMQTDAQMSNVRYR